MKRVVVTGYGIVSCLGNDANAVLDSLKQGRSGIKFQQDYVDMGMRSHIAGGIDIDTDAFIDRKVKRFMGDSAAYAYISMQQAIEHACLSDDMVSSIRTGIIMGSGGGSSSNQVEAADILRSKGLHQTHLDQWRLQMLNALQNGFSKKKSKRNNVDAKRIRALEKELRRKDKALAETAALLVLKKKVQEIWGDEDDPTAGSNGK